MRNAASLMVSGHGTIAHRKSLRIRSLQPPYNYLGTFRYRDLTNIKRLQQHIKDAARPVETAGQQAYQILSPTISFNRVQQALLAQWHPVDLVRWPAARLKP